MPVGEKDTTYSELLDGLDAHPSEDTLAILAGTALEAICPRACPILPLVLQVAHDLCVLNIEGFRIFWHA
jgi:hypothetical protein